MDSKRGARAATAVGVIIAAGIAGTGVASAETAPAATHRAAQTRITSIAQLKEGIQQAVTAERSNAAPQLATHPVGLASDVLSNVKLPEFSTGPVGYFSA
ncbi:hypothetical protein GXW83_17080 [Streptacidiphilus sp. PB12-B1b]|uniref:hypothetical protein n=1 Tax=Streptacidiphilus sp. PB12-B1b TaxID=2705012 RepID=UPI0015FB168D|nr:hypothetical protein [Streptacidiphilus sp. PB12-B1b]QMU77165.1 hypothetical protein GXW83_17080 [Streptacidiphilus sp. PB12-B1b]